ncbi:MAG: hypothetical protein COU85_00635 [Candidatus Portnoybacteria bacterium CG10_big_fil_rev_8_21_14_0_10_44_7]|uniref:GlxA-like beta barrel domain-containing protein n=1 Tax=Candidatus Portnoybacteria bacterium CG10_big_fil_rev_8_21_14_0_10_44_7 TaxID=1974816 RepID=A0A2M8KJB0_9BACT|nr:MAG: hypothetical protein COU85_00635 [Candidatus Portnoybacteria bacterium CG10_big_fil_rev_8_21_14_0_10_44_7]
MNEKKFFINQEEEIISIVDKILQVAEPGAVLFFPYGAQIFQSNVNLKLLKREADNADKRVTIVTEDERGQKMAQKNGFLVFNSKDAFDQFEASQHAVKDKTKISTTRTVKPATKKISPKPPAKASPGRVIDLRSGAGPAAITDIKISRKDDDYFEKLLEEKESQPEVPLGENGYDLSIDLEKGDNKAGERLTGQTQLQFAQPLGRLSKQPAKKKFWNGFWSPKRPGVATSENADYIQSAKEAVPVKDYRQTEAVEEPSVIKKSQLPKMAVLFALAGLLVLIGVCYFVLPKAEISLVLKRNEAGTRLLAVADKTASAVDQQKTKIPAKVLEVRKNESKNFSATGQKQVNKKATGKITVFNEYSSSPQTLVETTRFLAESGLVFRTTEQITVPGATIQDGEIIPSSIEVSVAADQPGEEYNIGPGSFTIPGFAGSPKHDKFYGRSQQPMAGGKIGTVTIISEQDMQAALEKFSAENILSLTDQVKQQVPEGYILLDRCIEQQRTEDKTTANVGDQVDSFDIAVDFSVRALAFPAQAINELAIAALQKEINNDNFVFQSDSLLIEYKDVSCDFALGRADLSLGVAGNFVQPLVLENIKQELAGKNAAQVGAYFTSLPAVASGEVSFWPFFVRRVPQSPDRIEIKIN